MPGLSIKLVWNSLILSSKLALKRGPDAAAEDGTAVDTTAEDATAEDATAELSRKEWTLRRSHQILTLPWTLRRGYDGFLVVFLLKNRNITDCSLLCYYQNSVVCYSVGLS